ncbi:DnaJ domain-containing protein [Suillus subaureus]|uniref:DnaJ domain-containing protein n=1 Tax=Suillus subaureus TaxID=48587 RepID=A0A9P7DWB9_9AGAM|nr:DnaJ domain-containing protein [Suillus subaureus]KAG1804532.1 DnaJ domain-containing protein [Suillus subaureus]
MASNLYETLGLSRDATPDQIRKAYRRKALETHPDRLPQGASPAQKSASEEMFRKVNNAYEVLSNPDNRKAYDQYGVWPPPTAQESYTQGNWQHPFILFNQIFGDLHQAFSRDPFGDPFGHRDDGFFGRGFMSPMSMPHITSSPFGFLTGGNVNAYSSSSRGGFAGGPNSSRWVSESYTTSTVNGVTHTKAVRRDSQGNEHVTYSFPDGTERRLINGVEQPSNSNPPPSHHNNRAIAAPPPSQDPPPPYDTVIPPPASGSRRSSRSIHSRSRDYARQPQDPNPTYSMQPQAPYASQYADPNSSGHQKNNRRHASADEARGGTAWNFWK